MKKFILWLVVAVVSAAISSGAADLPPVILVNDVDRGQGEAILMAIQAGNYRQFLQAANEPERNGDAEQFKASYEKLTGAYGKITGFRFLTYLQTPLVVNQIWVMDFVKFDQHGREVKRQLLLQLLFGEQNGQMRLVGMRVI